MPVSTPRVTTGTPAPPVAPMPWIEGGVPPATAKIARHRREPSPPPVGVVCGVCARGFATLADLHGHTAVMHAPVRRTPSPSPYPTDDLSGFAHTELARQRRAAQGFPPPDPYHLMRDLGCTERGCRIALEDRSLLVDRYVHYPSPRSRRAAEAIEVTRSADVAETWRYLGAWLVPVHERADRAIRMAEERALVKLEVARAAEIALEAQVRAEVAARTAKKARRPRAQRSVVDV